MTIRTMTIEDFDQVHALWMTIKGFGIRSIDDSKEGVERFLKRNPTTSVVAEIDNKSWVVFYVGTMGDVVVFTMFAWMKNIVAMVSGKRWLYMLCRL